MARPRIYVNRVTFAVLPKNRPGGWTLLGLRCVAHYELLTDSMSSCLRFHSRSVRET